MSSALHSRATSLIHGIIFINNASILYASLTWKWGDPLTGQTAWWNYLGTSNIITDTVILAQAIVIIIRLRTNLQKKAILTSVFAFRVLSVLQPHLMDLR